MFKYPFSQYLIRVGAYMIDTFITYLLMFIGFVPGFVLSYSMGESGGGLVWFFVVILICVGSLFGFGYFLLRDGFKNGSIGKQLFNLQVIDDKTNGPIGMKKSLIRNFMFMIIGTIDVFVPFFNPKGKKASDMVADTTVVVK